MRVAERKMLPSSQFVILEALPLLLNVVIEKEGASNTTQARTFGDYAKCERYSVPESSGNSVTLNTLPAALR